MSSDRPRRVVRRLRYNEDGATVDVTTIITRPTRTPPAIPGAVETPPSPAPNLIQFPSVSSRFAETLSRAASMVDEDHPLQNAAATLTSISRTVQRRRRPAMVLGSISMGMSAPVAPSRLRYQNKPKIIYDTVKVDSTKKIDDTDKCPICLDEYEENQECGVLPCKHNFHNACIRQWVDSKRNCPLCRLQLG